MKIIKLYCSLIIPIALMHMTQVVLKLVKSKKIEDNQEKITLIMTLMKKSGM